MKICITSQGSTLDALAEERFGRAPFFIIADAETGSFEALKTSLPEDPGELAQRQPS